MKTIAFLLTLVCCSGLFGQNDSNIVISYDKAGSIIEKKIQVMPQVSGRIGRIQPKAKDSIPVVPELKIFPNPANTYLTIQGTLPNNIKKASYNLITVSGTTLRSGAYTGLPETIYVGDLKPGLYLLEIKYSEKSSKNYKVIIAN